MSAAARVRTARNTIVAAWECGRGPVADPATEAAQALEDRGLLQSPETAGELEHLRKDRDAFRDQRTGVFKTNERLIVALQEEQDARLRAENDVRKLTREVAELEAANERAATHSERLAALLVARTQDLMAAENRVAESEKASDIYPPALPWAKWLDEEDLADCLDELAAAAIAHVGSAEALAEIEKTCATWRVIAEATRAHLTAPGPNCHCVEPVLDCTGAMCECPVCHRAVVPAADVPVPYALTEPPAVVTSYAEQSAAAMLRVPSDGGGRP